MTPEFIKEFAYWCPLEVRMFYIHEDYSKALHELMKIAEECPEIMKKGEPTDV